jgi:ABC-type oligopeptide transport system substrate-binding subunit
MNKRFLISALFALCLASFALNGCKDKEAEKQQKQNEQFFQYDPDYKPAPLQPRSKGEKTP